MGRTKRKPQIQTRPITREDAAAFADRYWQSISRSEAFIASFHADDFATTSNNDDETFEAVISPLIDTIRDRFKALMAATLRPLSADALYREGNAVLGYPVDDGFPKYDVPSWQIYDGHPEDDPVDENGVNLTEVAVSRNLANLHWFFTHPQKLFDTMEAAELLAIPPADVAAAVEEIYKSFVVEEDGRYPRYAIFATAYSSCVWNEGDIVDVFFQATDAVNDTPSEQIAAIRSFITDPKDTYTCAELRAIYGKYFTDVESLEERPGQGVSREDARGYLRGYVSPVVIGRAVEGLPPGPLTLKTITLSLPKWIVDAIEATARNSGDSAGDILADMIADETEGLGISTQFAERLPNYGSLFAKSLEALAGRDASRAADRTASAIKEHVSTPQRPSARSRSARKPPARTA